jgi:hypothetical protein
VLGLYRALAERTKAVAASQREVAA